MIKRKGRRRARSGVCKIASAAAGITLAGAADEEETIQASLPAVKRLCGPASSGGSVPPGLKKQDSDQ